MKELEVVMCTQAVLVCGGTEKVFKSGVRPKGIELFLDGEHVVARREGYPEQRIHPGVLSVTVAKPKRGPGRPKGSRNT